MLVLAVTVVAAWFLFAQARFASTVVDAIWSMLFAANWRFASTGSDYFQASGPVSPLQHYWSLGVEEQFYFVWPWLMLLAFVIFLRGRRAGSPDGARLVAGIAIAVLSVVSFAWAMWQTAENPTVAYYSTLTRGWELGIGAGLAVLLPQLTRLPAALRPVIAWVGLAAMTASLFVIGPESPFPGPAAVLPVLGTALVIAAGSGAAEHRGLAVLTNPVSRYLGDISYSMYLWHWPIIIFGGMLLGDLGFVDDAILIVAIVLSSVYSYHLVEDPIRRSGWLESRATRAKRTDRVRPRRAPARRAWGWVSLVAVVAIFVAAIGSDGWQVKSYGTFGCSFMEPLIDNEDPNVVENCDARKDAAIDAINALQPDLVFITNTYDPRVPVGEDEALTPDSWKTAMTDIVARFQDSAGRIVFLAPPPNDVHIAVCYSQVAVPADCISRVTDQWSTYSEADAEVAAELGAAYVSSERWFCVDGLCASFVGDVPTKSDHVHMLPDYAIKIAPAIWEELTHQGLL